MSVNNYEKEVVDNIGDGAGKGWRGLTLLRRRGWAWESCGLVAATLGWLLLATGRLQLTAAGQQPALAGRRWLWLAKRGYMRPKVVTVIAGVSRASCKAAT
jgi:hypothetical protein